MNPYEYNIVSGGVQRANFIMPLLAFAGEIVGGAISAGAGAVGALASGTGTLAGSAIGAGGSVLGGIGELGGGIFQTGAGLVQGAGTALFGGGPVTPGLTVGESFAAMAEPGYYGETAGGVFSSLSADTLGSVASLGYNIYQSEEQRKLTAKAIEAQRKAGYVVGAPAGTTALAPTTSIAIPAAAAAARPAGMFEGENKKMITYGIIAVIAYFLFKGM